MTKNNITDNKINTLSMKNLKNILENRFFISFITGVIIINALTLGLETSPKITKEYGFILSFVNLNLRNKKKIDAKIIRLKNIKMYKYCVCK